MVGCLGGLALLLAAIGVYGLIANSVVERTREMGIRMALGASSRRVLADIAVPGVLLAACGIIAGLILSAITVRALQSVLYGVSALDTPTFAGVAAMLLLAALAASLIPALRVTRLNPASTLRNE